MSMDRITRSTLISAAVGALVTATAQAQVHPEKPTYKFERCYGIAKAGKNDCFTVNNSCAGTTTRDNEPGAWIYVPKGTCERITGGRIQPSTE